MTEVLIFTDVNEPIGYAKYAGAWRVASELRSIGASVRVVDCFTRLSLEQTLHILDQTVSDETLFVGVASTLLHDRDTGDLAGHPNEYFAAMYDKIKSINPGCDMVLGGSRVSWYTYARPFDYYFMGKADHSIKHFYRYKKGTGPGITVHDRDGRKIIRTEDYNVSSDYFAKTQIVYDQDDVIDYGESLPLEIARGCIFKCTFCQYDLIGKKKSEYLKDGETLREELIRNYEQFGTTNYLFTDELVNESIEKVRFLHGVFTSLPFEIQWTAYARLDLFHGHPEMRELLLEAGAAGLIFGIETLDEKAGKAIRKGLGKDRIFRTLDRLKEAYEGRVVMSSNFIVGLPYETKESILETFRWLETPDCGLDAFSFTPLNLRNREDGRVMSEISLNPEKFGYTQTGKRNNMIEWENEHLSYQETIDMVRDFYQSPGFLQKSLIGSGNMLGRVTNIGYTMPEVKEMIFTPKSTEQSMAILDQWKDRSETRVRRYIDERISSL